MTVCTGRGANGDHCCYIAGKVCEFLFTDRGGTPRCSLFDQWGSLSDNPEWTRAPVGQWFAETYPGFDCKDWPQNLPAVMAKADITGPFGLCCWGRGNA
jgi:hypothetical protein